MAVSQGRVNGMRIGRLPEDSTMSRSAHRFQMWSEHGPENLGTACHTSSLTGVFLRVGEINQRRGGVLASAGGSSVEMRTDQRTANARWSQHGSAVGYAESGSTNRRAEGNPSAGTLVIPSGEGEAWR